MSWLAVLRLLLALAGSIADIVREKQLLNAGEDRANAKALLAIAQRLQVVDIIRGEVAAMTDEQAIKEATDT